MGFQEAFMDATSYTGIGVALMALLGLAVIFARFIGAIWKWIMGAKNKIK